MSQEQQINNSSTNNIEALISEISFKIIDEITKLDDKKEKKALNLIEKALGVLSNNGVYAYYVYIISQKEETFDKIFLDKFEELFKLAKNEVDYNTNNRQSYFQNISEDLHKLLFLKQLLEKTLIYARYHAKALGED